MTRSRKISFGSVLLDLIIDFALMGMGALLYYHFKIQSLAPVTISPAVVKWLGGTNIAVLLLAGLPFVIGLFSFLRLATRILSGMAASLRKP